MHFEIVPRSSLEGKRGSNFGRWGGGPGGAGPPNVRHDKSGRLSFSVRAADVFKPHKMLIAGFDKDARALCFTAVEKPPEGYDVDACYRIQWIKGKNLANHCTLAAGHLLAAVGFKAPVCMDFPVINVDPESHSIIVGIPEVPAAKTGEAETAADRPRVNGEEHAAA